MWQKLGERKGRPSPPPFISGICLVVVAGPVVLALAHQALIDESRGAGHYELLGAACAFWCGHCGNAFVVLSLARGAAVHETIFTLPHYPGAAIRAFFSYTSVQTTWFFITCVHKACRANPADLGAAARAILRHAFMNSRIRGHSIIGISRSCFLSSSAATKNKKGAEQNGKKFHEPPVIFSLAIQEISTAEY
jgi:hypothetical protein